MEILSSDHKTHPISPSVTTVTGSGDYFIIGATTLLEEIQMKNFEAIFNAGRLFAPMVFSFKGENENYCWFDTGMAKGQNHYITTLFKSTLVQQAHNADLIISQREFTVLYSEYLKALEESGYKPSISQRRQFSNLLQKISESKIVDSKLFIKVSEDDELLLVKESSTGLHYLITGPEVNDVSYTHILPEPGKYYSLHLSDKEITSERLIEEFVKR